MSNRTILYMTASVIIGVLVILAMNVARAFDGFSPKYLSPNDVRGIAVKHNNLPYTLNFEQQNSLLDILNHSIPIGPDIPNKDKSTARPEFESLVIYRFRASDIEIRPIAYVKIGESPSQTNALVFSAPIWNPNGLMQQTTSNDFITFISKAYDP